MNKRLVLLAALVLSSAVGAADVTSPDALVRDVTNEVLEIVRKDKDIRDGNTRKTLDLVETKVLPHFKRLSKAH